MKIISKPDISGWTLQHTCRECDAVLEIEAQDLKFNSGQAVGNSDWYTACCAVCGQSMQISDSKIPKVVSLRIRGKIQYGR